MHPADSVLDYNSTVDKIEHEFTRKKVFTTNSSKQFEDLIVRGPRRRIKRKFKAPVKLKKRQRRN